MNTRPDDYDTLAADHARHRRINPDVVVRLTRDLRPDAWVLELGCGTGNYISEIARRHGCHCVGINPSVEMIDRARARRDDVTVTRESAEELTFPDSTFDLVCSVDVVRHLIDRPRFS